MLKQGEGVVSKINEIWDLDQKQDSGAIVWILYKSVLGKSGGRQGGMGQGDNN